MENNHLFSFSNDIFEAMENMELRLLEMQMFCDEQNKKRLDLENKNYIIEKEFLKQKQDLELEILKLKKVYIHDMNIKCLKDNFVPPLWIQNNTFEKDDIIAQLKEQNNILRLSIEEKNAYIENCKWKLKEAETTITLLTAERTQIALEADELALRVDQYECALEFGKVPVNKCSSKLDRVKSSYPKNGNSVSSINSVPDTEYDDFSDYENSGNALVRAANFTNICALDETLDFKMELDKQSIASGNDIFWSAKFPSSWLSTSISSLNKNGSHNSLQNIDDILDSSDPNINDKFTINQVTHLESSKNEWYPFSSDTDIPSDTSASSPISNFPILSNVKRKRTSDIDSKTVDLFSGDFSKLSMEILSPMSSNYDIDYGELFSTEVINKKSGFKEFENISQNQFVVVPQIMHTKKSDIISSDELFSTFPAKSKLIVNNDKNELIADGLGKKFPAFSKDLNLSSNYSEDLNKNIDEIDSVVVKLENSAESGIFCSDKSESDIRSSTSSLCRHNSDCLPESSAICIKKLTRNKSDPQFGCQFVKKNKKPLSLLRYEEWLDSGKIGKPPVQISEC
ncbi:uncharacterized protein LOC101235735 isoform X2 [Hydra vulgaris]|uniref:uncharacterized protein LOC101235735 isoform X2 n=1 Tax=Hydra vulgaris TaxID=6087 RepID=UPI001F5F9FFB|nr:uncharacterized protein LOC101235735 isoform X2 [Hydra vulgaris]